MIPVFDRLRDVIWQSSDFDPPGSHGWDTRLGVVQKIAYPELVPANCFYDMENDDLIFFDQEFSRENCPASVPLSRALLSLHYSPIFVGDEQIQALLALLIERYELSECWDLLQEIEYKCWEDIFKCDEIEIFDDMVLEARGTVPKNVTCLLDWHWGRTKVVAGYIDDRWKKIGIYGYGKRGRWLHDILRLNGIEVFFVMDQDAKSLLAFKRLLSVEYVFENIEEVPEAFVFDVIIVTPKADADEIVMNLREKTMLPVVTLDEILDKT